MLATFGWGYWILENLCIPAELDKKNLDKDAYIYQSKDALMYTIHGIPLWIEEIKVFRANLIFNSNLAPGAVVSYTVKDDIKSLKDIRQMRKKKKIKGIPVYYPSLIVW